MKAWNNSIYLSFRTSLSLSKSFYNLMDSIKSVNCINLQYRADLGPILVEITTKMYKQFEIR